MEFINNLKELVCANSGQVDVFVKAAMRQQEIDNNERSSVLKNDVPRHDTAALKPEDTESLLHNNNPASRPNMIEVLNTPFDHIERIVLQDFSDTLFNDDGTENYFKGLFTFPSDSTGQFHGGFSGFTMWDNEDVSDFEVVNSKFDWDLNQNKGGFFVDSFTYTPFVDYSQVGEGGDPRVGVYSDQFLTDYNTEKYDVVDNQVDRNRNKLSSKLYELGNLKKDLEDAKVAFRNAITYMDGQE